MYKIFDICDILTKFTETEMNKDQRIFTFILI